MQICGGSITIKETSVMYGAINSGDILTGKFKLMGFDVELQINRQYRTRGYMCIVSRVNLNLFYLLYVYTPTYDDGFL